MWGWQPLQTGGLGCREGGHVFGLTLLTGWESPDPRSAETAARPLLSEGRQEAWGPAGECPRAAELSHRAWGQVRLPEDAARGSYLLSRCLPIVSIVHLLLVATAIKTHQSNTFCTISHVAECLDTDIFSSWVFLNLSQQTNLEANMLLCLGTKQVIRSRKRQGSLRGEPGEGAHRGVRAVRCVPWWDTCTRAGLSCQEARKNKTKPLCPAPFLSRSPQERHPSVRTAGTAKRSLWLPRGKLGRVISAARPPTVAMLLALHPMTSHS